jgi:5-formyltetrahydrofolate cyclo-ligase
MSTRVPDKTAARQSARERRKVCAQDATPIAALPVVLNQSPIAAYWPIGTEVDIRPLLHRLHAEGRELCLPVVTRKAAPLTFRRWTPDTVLRMDLAGVPAPLDGDVMVPKLILLPLLAFTARGDRLGYGGGYYDRTIQALRGAAPRRTTDVFACGVAYAGQEVAQIPTDPHDARLDGILTPDGYRTFT